MLNEDVDLRTADVQAMSGPDGVARLFLTLGYPVERLPLSPEALSITAEDLKRQIRCIEQIAILDDWLRVYLLEMRSMRVADRQALARTLRNAAGDYLLVLTSDYDTLDMVLLDKTPPKGDGTGATRRQVAVRPRVLTVVRKNPGPVALRVLRRFTCTEAHAEEQFEKLLSAYTVAEWSEPLFNNRALFSDYYLKERLPGLDEWQEDPTAAHRSMRELVVKARPCLSKADEGKTRAVLLEPLFTALGFSPRQVKAAAGDGERPDYLLLDAAGGDEPLVTCLTYPWNRYLDGQDHQRDAKRPTDNPGARVVSLLQDGTTPYAILTNGKLWRLYAAQTHSRATNYYEIDLEEALHSKDRQFAFRYFWLFFRAAAFRADAIQLEGQTRRLCFLDRLVDESETYAKELRERLKDRVFEQITPSFAEGFVAHIRQVEGPHASLNQERLDLIYASTLTFLYRLMFVLYAEALGLLPVNEVRGYWRVSVQRLKEEVAERGGTIDDESPGRLRKAYRADSTELYDRLLELFAVIDGGSMECNVPRYNGGLFLTEPDPADDDQEARIARFLQEFRIPDRHLALGLDRLARDLDDKTHALVFVDFESLGVRQLGSIYEGLLEFRLRIAPAKMAVVKGKRADEIIPYAEAKQKKRAILTTGRGAKAVERTIAKGEVYLENDRRERKATGSYYTPDYIVRYIVEHTVGPVLEEKLEALRPRLREAERAYRRHVKNAEAKSRAGGRFEDPEKFWNSEEMLRLAYDVLDIKVLDPAMGSGHFLVEVVDAITDRLLDFLNAFPHNPVAAGLRRTREAILGAMEEQRVSIDRDQLNDVALLKRQVLKRCVYGVDLNLMAVELAKVSLWLDAFTLGAPLSFLDHHLRRGNSLIGAMAREADDELRRGERNQLTFLDGPFVGLLRSAEIMRGIGMLADATMEQAQESAALFREFEQAARPYKQLLDIYVMRDFGIERADEFLRLYGVDAMRATPKTLGSPYGELLVEREAMYRRHRFFHWDLEFPEVFIDLARSTWKDDPGFDATVGNPPYDELTEQSLGRPVRERTYLDRAKHYHPVYDSEGRKNWYHYFMVIGILLARARGRNGQIVPMSWMGDQFTAGVRRWLLTGNVPILVDAFPQKDDPSRRVFEDAKLSTSVFVSQRGRSHGPISVRVHPGKYIEPSLPYVAEVSAIRRLVPSVWVIPVVTPDGWALLQRLSEQRFCTLAEVAQPTSGEITFNAATRPFLTSDGTYDLVLRGSHVQRYEVVDYAKQGEPVYLKTEQYLAACGGDTKAYAHRYPRVVYQEGSAIDAWRRVVAAYLPAGAICGHKICYFTDLRISEYALLAVFASQLVNWLVESLSVTNSLPAYLIGGLPFARLSQADDQHRSLSHSTQVSSVKAGNHPEVLEVAKLDPGTDTEAIHDMLANLACRMTELNRQKQAETRRFLGWFVQYTGTSIDDLSGRTIIANYLGDYQKGEGELPWDEFLDRLQRNRSKIRANLSDPAVVHRLRQEYEESLATLLPMKQRLKETDWLIDQIVYKLYGLTEEEIAIVEGRS